MRSAGNAVSFFIAGLFAATGLASAQAPPPEVWVVNEGSKTISIIDTALNRVVDTIDVADPDGDGTEESPWGLAFSSVPGSGGEAAFVTQDELLTVIDVATRRVLATHDLRDDLAVAALKLRGSSAARPRLLTDAAGLPVVASWLHVSATLPGGEARFVVLDQEDLLRSAAAPLVAEGQLARDATALDVVALDNPHGNDALRAWYTLETEAGIAAVQVAQGPALGDPWRVVRRVDRAVPAPQGSGAVLGPGSPRDRELPVLPELRLGRLENLDTGGRCEAGGDQAAVAVTGFGPNSYTVLSVDRSTDEVVVVDARDCSETRRDTGAGPVDIALLGASRWQAAFVANRDEDSVTRLDVDGTLTAIPISSAPPPCVDCPISLGVSTLAGCGVDDVTYSKADTDLDGSEDDVEISWTPVGECTGFEFVIGCDCVEDDPLCPCYCDCQNDPLPECFCPGLLTGGDAISVDVPAEALAADPWGTGGPLPWKELGRTVDDDFALDDFVLDPGSVTLDVHSEPQDP